MDLSRNGDYKLVVACRSRTLKVKYMSLRLVLGVTRWYHVVVVGVGTVHMSAFE